MSGFKASEAVEELSYDFHPYVDVAGVIPEPTGDQIEAYRTALVTGLQGLNLKGLDPANLDLSTMDDLMAKVPELEALILGAPSVLTGIPEATRDALPYRVSRAFVGYIMGTFFSPEV